MPSDCEYMLQPEAVKFKAHVVRGAASKPAGASSPPIPTPRPLVRGVGAPDPGAPSS
jgi:hypothetical protein